MAAQPPFGLLSVYLPDAGFQWITMHRKPFTNFDNCVNILFAMQQYGARYGAPVSEFLINQLLAHLFIRARELVHLCENNTPFDFWSMVGCNVQWSSLAEGEDVFNFATRVMAARVTFRHRQRKYEEESQEVGDIPQRYRIRDHNVGNIAVDDFIYSVIQYYGLKSTTRELFCPDGLTEPTVSWAPIGSHQQVKQAKQARRNSKQS
ncbi:hypothetical protein F5Y02DRAFT_417580 [Annulohypoxylon stygium]|nr:hypothetical protein F5Y02DRAFT_417580 [Annulohypoxylon stygium]